MQKILNQLWKLNPGELASILTMGCVILSNSVAQKIAEISAISGFVSDVGVDSFLILLIGSSAISIIATALQSFLIDRFDRLTLLCNTSLVMAVAFFLLRILLFLQAPNWLSYSFFYLLCEQQFTFFPLFFWLLANDLFSITQTKRIFPLLSAWSFAGDLIGIGIATVCPLILLQMNNGMHGLTTNIKPDEEASTISIVIYIFIYLLLRSRLTKNKFCKTEQRSEKLHKTISEGWSFVRQVPSFRYLALSILMFAVCEVIVEFNFYIDSTNTFTEPDRYQTFLGIFILARLLIYFVVQGFLTRWIMVSIGLKRVFLIQPFSSIVGVVLLLLMPGLTSSTVGVLLQKVPHYSVAETARKALQNFVPEERRGRVSLFLDSYLMAGGTMLSALATYLIVKFGVRYATLEQSIRFSLLLAFITSVIAIWSVLKLRSVYDISLLNWRLKRRQRCRNLLNKLDRP